MTKHIWWNILLDLLRGDRRCGLRNARFMLGMWVGGFTKASR